MMRFGWLFSIAVVLEAMMPLAKGGNSTFTVTHYNLNVRPTCLAEARTALKTSSHWIDKPITKTYPSIHFGNNVDPRYPSHFSSIPFPGNTTGKHEWYVVEITGTVAIPSAGDWTFACGSDDGFSVHLYNSTHSIIFSSDGIHGNETTLHIATIPNASKYTLQLLYYEGGGSSALEFSSAKGRHSSFSSAFKLVGATDNELRIDNQYTVTFLPDGGTGEMEEQGFIDGVIQRIANNQFFREGYHFIGWAKTAGGEKVYGDGEEVEVTGDMTLYAVWERDTYQIRFHGNLYGEGEGNFVDQTFTFGEEQALMENPFKEGGFVPGDISGEFLGWSVGTPEFDWDADVRWWGNRKSVKLEEADLLEYARTGAATVEDGVPTLHLYAVWRSKVTVNFHGADGGELAPASMKDHMQFKLDDNKWSCGGKSFYVGPGTHKLRVVAESGYEGYIAGWRLFWGETDLTDGGGVGSFTIPSVKAGPYDVRLEVRLRETAARGEVTFRCVDARTDAQKAVWAEWPDFPAFDPGKVRLALEPLTGSGGRLEVRNEEREALPVGEYLLEAEYAETTGRRKFPFWEKTSPQTVTIEEDKSQEVEVTFLPFGRDGAYSFATLTFDGAEGDVSFKKMWFVHETTALGGYIDRFSETKLPTATRKGGWKFDGWEDWKGRKIETLDDLASSVKRWLNAEPPLRSQTFEAQWKPVEDAATGSGVPVPNAWLTDHAAAVLAANGGDYEAASVATASSGRAMWEYYVVGQDPESGEELRTEIHWNEGKPIVKPSLDLPEGRVVKIEARKSLATGDDGEEWTDVTDVEDLEAEGWRFFRVGVEMAE